MIDILRNSLNYLFLAIICSAIFAPIMINILYRLHQVSGIKKSKIGADEKGDNSLFMRIMRVSETNGTPNLGGILIWIVVPLIVSLTVPLTDTIKVFLLGFFLYGLWGLLDVVVFTNGFKNNEKVKAFQERFEWRLGKLLVSSLINIGIMFLLYNTGQFSTLSFFNIFTISLTPILLILLGFLGQLAVYSAEITDGLDGLMMGIFTIINFSFIVLLLVQGRTDFIPILCIILGVQVIDLYFNIPPARFWNGGPGAMPLGFAMFFVGVLTNNLIPYLAMSAMTWIIMLSSMIQMISLKFFKKRVFIIAPLHHHFQAKGWPQYKVTMRFWLFTFLFCIVGIYLGLL